MVLLNGENQVNVNRPDSTWAHSGSRVARRARPVAASSFGRRLMASLVLLWMGLWS